MTGESLWYLRGQDDGRGALAGRLIAVSFWALASWVSFDAVRDLLAGEEPEHSLVRIVLSAAVLAGLMLNALALILYAAGRFLPDGAVQVSAGRNR